MKRVRPELDVNAHSSIATFASRDGLSTSGSMGAAVRSVETILSYSFRDKRLLEEALTHPSFADSLSYERLEFVGDAVLGLALSNYVFLAYPDLEPGQLSLIRAANVSTEKLARVAIKHGLYGFVRRNASGLDDTVKEFGDAVRREDDAVFYGGSVKAPKILADIVEAVAAAVYVDVNFDLERLWVIFRGLLEPIVTLELLQQQPQPVTLLFELCKKQGKQVDIKHWKKGAKNIVSVYVEGVFVASSSSEWKEIARLNAAKAALHKLSNLVSIDGGMVEYCGTMDSSFEIQGAKQKLHELCGKKKWPKPSYTIEDDVGPPNPKKFECSVQIVTSDGVLHMIGDEGSRAKEAENSGEAILNYSFRDKHLLEEALTHPSFTNSSSYQRLEFVGDAVLCLAFSSHIYLAHPSLDPGQLSLLRAANISTEKLARVAVKHGLYSFVRCNASGLDDKVREFTDAVRGEDDAVVYGGSVKAPKILADIVEALVAAVYVDVDFDLERLWVIFRSLLEPIVTLELLQQQPHPVTLLFELCQKQGKQINIKHWKKGAKNIASVYVDGEFVASSSSEQKDIARLDVAKVALHKLSKLIASNCGVVEYCGGMDSSFEIQRAKQKLHELCCKKKWPKPRYMVEKGPPHDKTFVCSVQIVTADGVLYITGSERSRKKEAENSAASYIIRALGESDIL